MRYRILCAGLLASVAGTAIAADMSVRPGAAAVAPVAAPAFINEWAGFYVGIHGGGAWGHESFESGNSACEDTFCFPFELPPGVNPKGGVFGFQFGHNWQWGPVVGGLEIDFSGADIHGSGATSISDCCETLTTTTDKKIDALASARG